LDVKIPEILKELKDPNETQTLQRIGRSVREAIIKADLPHDVKNKIEQAYIELSKRTDNPGPYVAIRSSATAEDLPDASFAGQQETYLNIRGSNMVAEKVKECYASLFTDRAIFYRVQKGFDHMAIALSVAVQVMVYSKASGVMFTLNVANGDSSVVQIEAGYGLGEYVVQGTITPDEYLIRKSDLKIVSKNISTKLIQLVRKPNGGTVESPVPTRLHDKQVLSDEKIFELAKYAIVIEKHYGVPMDMEWGLDERTNKLWILQARPETVWVKGASKIKAKDDVVVMTDRVVIAQGLPASLE